MTSKHIEMLYNVLPPLLFFLSLGGFILVVSRVVLRIRHEQYASNLQTQVSQISNRSTNKVQDLAGILKPNHKSVQSFKNRIALWLHFGKESLGRFYQFIKSWRSWRQPLTKLKPKKISLAKLFTKDKTKPPVISSVEESLRSTDTIKPPSSPLRERLSIFFSKTKDATVQKSAQLKTYTRSTLATAARRTSSLRKNLAQNATKIKQTPSSSSAPITKPSLQPPAEPTKRTKPTLRIVNRDTLSDRPTSSSSKTKVLSSKPTTTTQNEATKIKKLFRKNKTSSILDEAAEALKQDKTAAAEKILIPYIIKNPRDTRAYMLLGKAALNRQAWSEAIEIFEQVVRLDPTTPNCYAGLGKAAYESGNLTKAIESLQRAHDKDPQNVAVVKLLLKIASRMDNQPMQQSLNAELRELEQG